MVTATQRRGPSACGAAVFAGLGLMCFKCQDKFIPPVVTAAGHGGPLCFVPCLNKADW